MARCRRNVDNFLDACRKIGVEEVSVDFLNNKKEKKVHLQSDFLSIKLTNFLLETHFFFLLLFRLWCSGLQKRN